MGKTRKISSIMAILVMLIFGKAYAEDVKLEYNKYGSNYQGYGSLVKTDIPFQKNTPVNITVSGISDADVETLYITLVDMSPAANYWFGLSSGDSLIIKNIAAGKKFEAKNTVYIENEPKDMSGVKVVFYTFEADKTITIKNFKMEISKVEYLPKVEDVNGTAVIKNVSAKALVKEMKAGWNLGNTLDSNVKGGLNSEISWGEPFTTKEIIDIGINNGYKTIRIPVTWRAHIIDDKYTIDPNWMHRVKTIVDWAIEDGYYVILNEHHSVYDNMNNPLQYGDGYIVRNNETDIAESEAFLKAIWTQIATAFNTSYDEHLIFETMNEPRNTSHEHVWQPGLKLSWCDNSACAECIADYKILNNYNQICLDAIRATGGNNANRFVMIPSLTTGELTPMHKEFKLPKDSASDKLILTIHSYTLGSVVENKQMEFKDYHKKEIDSFMKNLNKKYVTKGIPVVVGETGAFLSIPLSERINWITHFNKVANSYGMAVVYWDVGSSSKGKSEIMAVFNRNGLRIDDEDKDFVKAFTSAFN